MASTRAIQRCLGLDPTDSCSARHACTHVCTACMFLPQVQNRFVMETIQLLLPTDYARRKQVGRRTRLFFFILFFILFFSLDVGIADGTASAACVARCRVLSDPPRRELSNGAVAHAQRMAARMSTHMPACLSARMSVHTPRPMPVCHGDAYGGLRAKGSIDK